MKLYKPLECFREKNDPVKQGRVYEKYEKLCGIQHGGDRRSNGQFDRLISQEDIAKDFLSLKEESRLVKLN